MRLSHYTLCYSLNKLTVLFHTISGRVAIIPSSPSLHASNPGNGFVSGFDTTGLPESTAKELTRAGFLTSKTLSEEKSLLSAYAEKLNSLNTANDKKIGYLGLLLSYSCNDTCANCFQRSAKTDRAAKLSEKDVERIISSLNNLFPGVDSRDITVVLYGGEPFMPGNMETIRKILAISAATGFRIEALTNGLNISAYGEHFGPACGRVSAIQVSAHFPEATQADISTRFGLISPGIAKVLSAKCRVNLRLNLFPNEPHLIPGLDKTLQASVWAEEELFTAYLAPIQSHHALSRISGYYKDWIAFNRKWGKKKTFQHKLIESLILKEGRLRPFKTAFCMTHKPNSFIIDPELNIYNCFADVGHPEHSIGAFNPLGWTFAKSGAKRKGTIFNSVCLGCQIALFCGGSCSSHVLDECTGACDVSGCQLKKQTFEATLAAAIEDNRDIISKLSMGDGPG